MSTAPLTWGFCTMGCTQGTESLVSNAEKCNFVCFIHQHAINTGFFKKIDFENGTLFHHMFLKVRYCGILCAFLFVFFSGILLQCYTEPSRYLIQMCSWPPEEPSDREGPSFWINLFQGRMPSQPQWLVGTNRNLKLEWHFKMCLHYEFLAMVFMFLSVRRLVLFPLRFLFSLLFHIGDSLNILQGQLTFNCHWIQGTE